MSNYRNRIKGLEYVKAADLTAHPGNWRDHPKAQVEALQGVLSEVGIAGALLAYRSERAGGALVVIDGHLRKDAAPQKWPVLILDVDDAEADYLLATHDPLAAMAAADAGALDALLSSVQSGEAAVQEMLAELAEGAGLYAPKDDPADVAPQIDRAEELRQEWGVEPGSLWRLASRTPGQFHMLICGDCTDAAVVGRVMGGEKAEMVWTDPPYNVGIAGGTHDPRDYKNFGKGPRIENDNMSDEEFDGFLIKALSSMATVMQPGAAFYVCAPAGRIETQFRNAIDTVFTLRQCIVWAKQQAVFGRQDYHWKHESILYGWKDGAAHYFCNDRTQSTVWEIDRPMRSDKEHPTQKPIELPTKAIGNSSRWGALIYDPFLGSGTTLIAAENLGRQCRACEISAAYVSVALERYFQAFGIRAELITDGRAEG